MRSEADGRGGDTPRTAESKLPKANVYAAKGHPELTGADPAVTYSTAAYPYLRFVKLSLARR